MRLMILPALVLSLLSGCATSDPMGLCAGLKPLARDHARALLADGGDQAVVTGNRLLASIEAGCR